MNPIFGAALEVRAFCRDRDWKLCFIGAVAVQRWGEPRLTQDVEPLRALLARAAD